MTLEEVAKYLRVTTKTIYRMLERKTIPATRVGKLWRFDKNMIDQWLKHKSVELSASILVIDDDENICSLFKDTLEYIGYKVTTVDNSIDGVELAKTNDYSIVFLDLKMPEIDGAEVFRQIRLEKPELPVTIITGFTDSELMMKALTFGPLGVLKKPFTSKEILAAAKNYLSFNSLS